ncbi:MAG TPA: hypothetical protein VF932_03250, partial [Anaerolineae bacterium]
MIAGDLSLERRTHISRWQLARAVLIVCLFAVAFAFILAFQTVQETPPLVAGQVSLKAILAPERVTYASQIETTEART